MEKKQGSRSPSTTSSRRGTTKDPVPIPTPPAMGTARTKKRTKMNTRGGGKRGATAAFCRCRLTLRRPTSARPSPGCCGAPSLLPKKKKPRLLQTRRSTKQTKGRPFPGSSRRRQARRMSLTSLLRARRRGRGQRVGGGCCCPRRRRSFFFEEVVEAEKPGARAARRRRRRRL